MKQPPQQQQDRKPGRSFDDPSQTLGEGILDRSVQSATIKEDFRSPAAQQSDVLANGVAERAKGISALRKLEELIGDDNPPVYDEPTLRLAFELALGRVGVTMDEYNVIVKNDLELTELERKVFDAARAKFRA